MSVLTAAEHPDLHYPGLTAHCWVAPDGIDGREWDQIVRDHLGEHLAAIDRDWRRAALAAAIQGLRPGRHRKILTLDEIRTLDELGAALARTRAHETSPPSGLGSGGTPPVGLSGGTLPAGPATPPGGPPGDAR